MRNVFCVIFQIIHKKNKTHNVEKVIHITRSSPLSFRGLLHHYTITFLQRNIF